ncbi:MAG: flagellar biosynthesis protein FlhF [Clostridia bacterium]|nr:flagellar biosynthesis protein FlhF [Clostridia bacterium]
MKIKRYLARDMKEAYLAIRRDLGPEAVIVATRQVRQPGLRGFFLPPRLEVTAALEEGAEVRPMVGTGPLRTGPLMPSVPGPGEGGAFTQAVPAGDNPPGPLRVGAIPAGSPPATAGVPRPGATAPAALPGSRPAWEGLQRELAEIKTALSRLVGSRGDDLPEHLAAWRQRLLAQELEEGLVAELVAGLEASWGSEVIGEVLRTRLADRLSSLVAAGPGRRVQAFVGPTGVGKTTTLAKIAARHSLYQERKVGLITLDTYRIGAVDQLKTYAEIMGLPLEVAMTPRELRTALERLEYCDVVLVDTAGRAPENKAMLAETRGFLEVMPVREVHLVLSCATRRQDLLQAVENFRGLNYDRLIFTKLDESGCPGVILTVAAAAGVPLTYLTTGQDVPDDLEAAEPHLLARRIWEAVAEDGSSGQVA